MEIVTVHEVNGKLPAWLHVGGLFRTRLEGFLNRGFAPGENDVHLVNRFRLDVDLRVTRWMKFAFEGQDARIYFEKSVPNAPPFAKPMDLRLGYLEIGDIDTGRVSLRAGRQDLNFGEQRLLGNFNWINVGRSFDAVRLTLRHRGYRVDAFASSVVNPTPRGSDRPQTGNNLHGLYGSISKLVPASTIEPYVLWRIAPQQVSENGTRGTLDLKTVGVRWVGKANAIDYGTEMAGQFGLGPDPCFPSGTAAPRFTVVPGCCRNPRRRCRKSVRHPARSPAAWRPLPPCRAISNGSSLPRST